MTAYGIRSPGLCRVSGKDDKALPAFIRERALGPAPEPDACGVWPRNLPMWMGVEPGEGSCPAAEAVWTLIGTEEFTFAPVDVQRWALLFAAAALEAK